MRKCKKCNSEVDGKRCKICQKEYNKKYYEMDPEKHKSRRKNYYLINSELEKTKAKNKRLENPEKYKQIEKEAYQKRKSYQLDYNKKYREKNKEYFKKKRESWRSKKNEDPIYKFFNSIRHSILKSIKRGYIKNSKTLDILGCSYDELVKHFESKFESWMTWDNRGKYNGNFNFGWDIDHIIPISSAKTEKDIIKLNHYTNLQPLCSKINRDIKKDKIEYDITFIG